MPSMTIRTRRFSSGMDIVSSSMLSLVDHSSLTLSAPGTIIIPDPMNPGSTLTFAFLFWNVKGSVSGMPSVSVADVGSAPFTASSWYLQTGGGGGGLPTVSTAAFSITQDLVLPDSPIQSVTPGPAWAGGAATGVATAAAAVQITAKSAIGSENFQNWVVFGAGSPAGLVLSVPQNGSAIAMATYKVPERGGIGRPDFEFELIDIFDRIRGRLKDWVSDPSPIDLARLVNRFQQVSGAAKPVDDLSDLSARIGSMDAEELRLARADLQARATRLEAAGKMLDAAIKGK